ncbi:MAG: 50S ribosomal protein L11 methyltransferase [Acutalibacteraceae bacterium]|nr:50S ribosomal protein L11 methyltransferase [Acutalibacteraceae bacterium]
MDWIEILVNIPTDSVERASDICTMVVPYGFYIEDYSELEKDALEIAHIDLIDEDLVAKPRDKAIIHIYIDPESNYKDAVDFLSHRLQAENIPFEIDTNGVSEEDWANNWKKYFKPTEIGEKLLILPEWEEQPKTDRKILKIDPGAAFGTGTHSTTRLCLTAIEKYVGENKTVLDIGTGSGILSIASLLLGAKSAVGVDIDALAVKTAIDNGLKNGFVEPQYKMINGDLADKVNGKFDVCIANIVADVIIKLCDSVTDFILPNGLFITSGIIDTRADEVIEKLSSVGFKIVEKMEEKGWYCIVSEYTGEKIC